jgi:hypothetical protein
VVGLSDDAPDYTLEPRFLNYLTTDPAARDRIDKCALFQRQLGQCSLSRDALAATSVTKIGNVDATHRLRDRAEGVQPGRIFRISRCALIEPSLPTHFNRLASASDN